MQKFGDNQPVEVLVGREANVLNDHMRRLGKYQVSDFSEDERTALDKDLQAAREVNEAKEGYEAQDSQFNDTSLSSGETGTSSEDSDSQTRERAASKRDSKSSKSDSKPSDSSRLDEERFDDEGGQ